MRAFRSDGGKIVSQEAFEQAATNMRAQLTKVSSASPDFIYLLGQVVESGYILKQAAELRMGIPFLSHISIEGEDLLRIAGSAANGVIYTSTAYDPAATSASQRFEKAYRDRFARTGDMFAANAYDAVHIIRNAIRDAAYNAEGIRRALYHLQGYHGAAGITRFDSNGDVQRPVTLKWIHNGKFENISEDEVRRGR